MPLSDLREEVCYVNQMLPQAGLVTMHSGNASGLDRAAGRLVIKPSGVDYDRLTPADLVEVDLASGAVVDARLRPSVDLPHHLYLYRHLPEVGAVIHTHSNFATAFAAVGRAIPCCLTAIADEFGDEIPCAPYIDNVGDHIGKAILKHRNRSPAILLGNHGTFAWGPTPKTALKAAIMTEDVAKTVFLAMQLGLPAALPQAEIAKWYERYHQRYGQTGE